MKEAESVPHSAGSVMNFFRLVWTRQSAGRTWPEGSLYCGVKQTSLVEVNYISDKVD